MTEACLKNKHNTVYS